MTPTTPTVRRGRKPLIGDATAARLRAEHEAGRTVASLAYELKANYVTVRNAIVRAGGTIRRQRAERKDKGTRRKSPTRIDGPTAATMRADHEANGTSTRELARRHGVSQGAAADAIVRAGGQVNPRPRANADQVVTFPGVRVSARSGNAKLGDCAATYAAATTCPASCPFLNGGCYAEYDQTSIHWKPITEQADGLTAEQVATAEALAIRRTPAVRDMRLHVAGDSPTREGTRAIADACEDYVARGLAVGKRLAVFTYTHGWKQVLRSDWWRVSVLASCETVADVHAAFRRGYAAAVTVAAFPAGPRAFTLGEGEGAVKCVPCPAQTSETTCSECKLCMDDRRLLATRTVIAFETHGSGRRRANEVLGRVALPVVSADERRAAA